MNNTDDLRRLAAKVADGAAQAAGLGRALMAEQRRRRG